MSTEAEIRAAILAKLQGVNGIGQVHDYERYGKRDSDMYALYKDDAKGRLLGWNFYRESTAELEQDIGEVRRLFTWRINGFMSLDDADATGNLFQALIEDIASAFRADPTLGGVIDDNKDMSQEFGPVGLQVDAIEPVMFAGVLCHRARLRLITETTESK